MSLKSQKGNLFLRGDIIFANIRVRTASHMKKKARQQKSEKYIISLNGTRSVNALRDYSGGGNKTNEFVKTGVFRYSYENMEMTLERNTRSSNKCAYNF